MTRLPDGVKCHFPVHRVYGLEYSRPDGTPLFADMRGGWTPQELRGIADHIEWHLKTREKNP